MIGFGIWRGCRIVSFSISSIAIHELRIKPIDSHIMWFSQIWIMTDSFIMISVPENDKCLNVVIWLTISFQAECLLFLNVNWRAMTINHYLYKHSMWQISKHQSIEYRVTDLEHDHSNIQRALCLAIGLNLIYMTFDLVSRPVCLWKSRLRQQR